jgi:6-phosphogluconolactonase
LIAIPSETEFVAHAASFLTQIITEAIATNGRAVIGLSGGSTPRPIYEALGASQDIDWSKVWVFLVDDRHVRADSPHSNQFLLRSTLLRAAPIPESQLIFPDTNLPLAACATLYDQHVRSLLARGPADCVVLGMGEDGHIASLFPPLTEPCLSPGPVITTITEQFDIPDRITVTLPILTAARKALVLLSGKGKRKVLEQMESSSEDERRWPLKAVLTSTEVTVMGRW